MAENEAFCSAVALMCWKCKSHNPRPEINLPKTQTQPQTTLNAPNGLKMSPVLAAPSLRSPETLTVIPCLPGVRPRTSPWMVVGAPAADWDRRRTPATPDSPAILHVAEADMVAGGGGGGGGGLVDRVVWWFPFGQPLFCIVRFVPISHFLSLLLTATGKLITHCTPGEALSLLLLSFRCVAHGIRMAQGWEGAYISMVHIVRRIVLLCGATAGMVAIRRRRRYAAGSGLWVNRLARWSRADPIRRRGR